MQINTIPASALPVTEPQVPSNIKANRQGNDAAGAKKVAREFEAMFVGMMLKSMRETVGKEKLTGGGHGEETFRSMLDQQYAEEATRSGSIGLAPFIERELTRSSAAAPAPAKGDSHAD